MASKKISDLPAAQPLQGTELFETSQDDGGSLSSRQVALSVLAAYLGGGGSGYQDNLTATADPTANDDSSAGYSAGSTWFNTASGEIFRCLDASAGAAVWAKTSLTLDELGSMAVVNDAPSDGNPYVRQDATWQVAPTGGSGSGDVTGPAASADGELPAFAGTTGKLLKRSPLRLDAAGNLWGAGLKIEEVAGTSYSLTAADNGKILWFTSADPVAVTLPDNATTAIAGGFNVVLVQGGAGAVTATGEGADTVVTAGGPIATSGAATAISVAKKADTVWWASAGGSGGGGGGGTSGAQVVTVSGTSYTVAEADNGKTLWCTSNDPVTITFQGGTALTMGANIEGAIIQGGDGTVTCQGDGEAAILAEGDKLSTSAKGAPMSYFRQAENLYWLGGQRA